MENRGPLRKARTTYEQAQSLIKLVEVALAVAILNGPCRGHPERSVPYHLLLLLLRLNYYYYYYYYDYSYYYYDYDDDYYDDDDDVYYYCYSVTPSPLGSGSCCVLRNFGVPPAPPGPGGAGPRASCGPLGPPLGLLGPFGASWGPRRSREERGRSRGGAGARRSRGPGRKGPTKGQNLPAQRSSNARN